MAQPERWQISTDAAEIYESCFVPAIFGAWARRVADAAEIRTGDRVLDVGCGTGVLAREALGRVGESGRVVGLDLNEGMLAVAARTKPTTSTSASTTHPTTLAPTSRSQSPKAKAKKTTGPPPSKRCAIAPRGEKRALNDCVKLGLGRGM